MKLSLWNIFDALDFPGKIPIISDGSPTISSIRLIITPRLNSHTVYVGREGDFFQGGQDRVLIVHRNDIILVPNADIRVVFDRVCNIMDQYSLWSDKLRQCAARENSIQEMINCSRAILPYSMFCFAIGGQVLGAISGKTDNAPAIWNAIVHSEFASYQAIQKLNGEINFSKDYEKKTSAEIARSADPAAQNSYLYRHLRVNGKAAALLLMLLPRGFSQQGIVHAADWLAEWMELAIQSHPERIDLLSVPSSYLLWLLQQDHVKSEDSDLLFQMMRWKAGDTFQVMAFSPKDPEEQIQLPYYIRTMRQYFSAPACCLMEKKLIVLIDRTYENLAELPDLKYLNPAPDKLDCGTSVRFHYIKYLRLYKQQAVQEIDNCARKGLIVSSAYEHSDDFFLNAIYEQEMCFPYIKQNLIRLKQYDQAHNSQYYETLRVWMHTYFHQADTCRILGIHRNTFNYRLNKIREIIEFAPIDRIIAADSYAKLDSYYISFYLIDHLTNKNEFL